MSGAVTVIMKFGRNQFLVGPAGAEASSTTEPGMKPCGAL